MPVSFRAAAALLLLASTASFAVAEPQPAPRRPAPERWGDARLAAAYIGHATVLLRLGRTHLLTDPAFFERVGIAVGGVTIGPQRLVAPALPLDALPPLAAVLVSHPHFDSLDLPSLRALPRDATLVAPRGCRDLLGDLGFRAYVEIGWGERATVDDVVIEAVPVKHWGKRFPWGRDRGYNGYLLERDGMRVLFASDTGYTPHFTRFRQDGGAPLTLAIIGAGAYDPWIRSHADPEQVWRMFLDSGARFLAPIHWDTFRLGLEPVGDSVRRLRAAAGPEAHRIVFDEIGDEWILPTEESPR